MRKSLLIYILFLLTTLTVSAQQDAQFTQFMVYKLGYNPAYAGLDRAPTFTGLVRNQWLGFEGAPQSQLLSFNMPFGSSQRIGLGFTARRHTIGPTEEISSDISYAYHIPFARGRLGMGIMGTIRYMRINFSDAFAIQPVAEDPSIPGSIQSKYLPNFGFGVYYDSPEFYLGFSIPRLLQNSIDFTDASNILSREITHVYFMGGFIFGNPEGIQWEPQILVKYVQGAPFDADISLAAVFLDKHKLGASYRLGGSEETGFGESVSLFLSVAISNRMNFGVAYDATLSELRQYTNGSIEAFVQFRLGDKPEQGRFIDGRNMEENDFYK